MRQRAAIATYLILAANIYVAWALTGFFPTEESVEGYTWSRENLATGQWGALFLSTFAHGGILHLAGNMIGLLSLGPVIERRFGAAQFLGLYGAAGVGGGLAHVAIRAEPVLGASGAIFGLVGLASILTPRARMIFLWLIPMPMILATALYVAAVPFLLGAGGVPIAHEAHLGGLVVGAAGAFILTPRHALRAIPGVGLVLVTTWYAVGALASNGLPNLTLRTEQFTWLFVIGAYVAAFLYLAWMEDTEDPDAPYSRHKRT